VTIKLVRDCRHERTLLAPHVKAPRHYHRHQDGGYGANDLPLIHGCAITPNESTQRGRAAEYGMQTERATRHLLK